MTRVLGVIAVVGLIGCGALWGQTGNQGAIVGTVTDPSGLAAPQAGLVVRNTATGVERQSVSNDVGEYRFDFLIPGTYDVIANLAGFKQSVVSDVQISVGGIKRVDVRLEIGETTEEVEVTAKIANLNTENAGLSEVIDSEKIQNLPLNGREFLALAQLTPGAESGSIRRGTVYSRGYAIGVNGSRASYNSYQMDGADITTTNNELASSPALEGIQEFRIQTNLYSAQYGRAGGAVVSVVTKSGTNQIHGSLFEYHRNKALDALPWSYTGDREKLAPYLYNQFGGSIGGPIIKNKTFFFGTGEFFRQKRPGSLIVGFSPNARERAGDLSQTINSYSRLPVVLRNPFKKEVAPFYDSRTAQYPAGEIIPDGKIPANLISPVGRRIVDELWPEPNYNDPFLNLRNFVGGVFNQNKYLTRVDHAFSSKDSVFGTFDFNDYDTISRGWNKYNDTTSLQHARAASFTYTHTFTPTMLNDLKGTFLNYNSLSGPLLNDKNYGREFGISDSLHKNVGMPTLYVSGPTTMNIGGEPLSLTLNRTFNLRDNLVMVRGKHTFSLGGDWRRQDHQYQSSAANATYFFGFTEGRNDRADLLRIYLLTGDTFASTLMGVSNLIVGGLGEDRMIPLARNAYSGYIQDDWKVTPRFTLNLGLRYDYEAPFSITNGELMTLDFATGLPRYAKGTPASKLAHLTFKYLTDGPTRSFEPNTRDFAPRFGFALRPFSDDRTVVRGGYGIVNTSDAASYTVAGSYVNPFAGSTGYIYPKNPLFWPDRQEHITTINQAPYGIDYVTSSSPGGAFLVNDPRFPTGYVQHWNLTVGRQLSSSTVAEVGYVATRGVNLNSNQTLGGYDRALLAKVEAQNPTWAGDRGMFAKGYNSAYNSMQLQLRRQHSRGLSYAAQYTWSRAMGDASEDGANENTFLDVQLSQDGFQNVRRRVWGALNFDVRQRFTFYGVWELPVGRGKQFGRNFHSVVDSVLGGWRMNWIYTLQGGYPWTVTVGFNDWKRPNRVCDGNLPRGQRTADKWFDISCYQTVAPINTVNPATGLPVTYTPTGNAGANTIIGPGTNNWDWGVHKYFPLWSETRRLEFRAELFNAFNHPILQGPSSWFFFNKADGAKIVRAGNQRQLQLALRINF